MRMHYLYTARFQLMHPARFVCFVPKGEVPPPSGGGSLFDRAVNVRKDALKKLQEQKASSSAPEGSVALPIAEKKVVLGEAQAQLADVKGDVLEQRRDNEIVKKWQEKDLMKKSPVEAVVRGLGEDEEAFVLYSLVRDTFGKSVSAGCLSDGKPDVSKLHAFLTEEKAGPQLGFYFDDGEFYSVDNDWGGAGSDDNQDTGNFIDAWEKSEGLYHELAQDAGDSGIASKAPIVVQRVESYRAQYKLLKGDMTPEQLMDVTGVDPQSPEGQMKSAVAGKVLEEMENDQLTVFSFLKQHENTWVGFESAQVEASERLFVPDAGHFVYMMTQVEGKPVVYAYRVDGGTDGEARLFMISLSELADKSSKQSERAPLLWKKDNWKPVTDVDGTVLNIAHGLPAPTKEQLVPLASVIPEGQHVDLDALQKQKMLESMKNLALNKTEFKDYIPKTPTSFRKDVSDEVAKAYKKTFGEQYGKGRQFDKAKFKTENGFDFDAAVSVKTDEYMSAIDAKIQEKFSAEIQKLSLEDRDKVAFDITGLASVSLDVTWHDAGWLEAARDKAKKTAEGVVENVSEAADKLKHRGGLVGFLIGIFGDDPAMQEDLVKGAAGAGMFGFLFKIFDNPKVSGVFDRMADSVFTMSQGSVDFRYEQVDPKEFIDELGKDPLRKRTQLKEETVLTEAMKITEGQFPVDMQDVVMKGGDKRSFKKGEKFKDVVLAKGVKLPAKTVLYPGTAFEKET